MNLFVAAVTRRNVRSKDGIWRGVWAKDCAACGGGSVWQYGGKQAASANVNIVYALLTTSTYLISSITKQRSFRHMGAHAQRADAKNALYQHHHGIV